MCGETGQHLAYRSDTASAIGIRTINADAVGVWVAHDRPAFALADGVGDCASSARAARLAATTAARVAAEVGAVGAVLAAQQAVHADQESGDCVLVVAVAEAQHNGFRIAWVGDVRAWAWRRGAVHQLTVDHTLAEYFRARGQLPAPRMEHMVTTSVRTAAEAEIGSIELLGSDGLLLTSDGVHKPLDAQAIGAALCAATSKPATALVTAAIEAGGTDNTTALLITTCEPSPGLAPPDPETVRIVA